MNNVNTVNNGVASTTPSNTIKPTKEITMQENTNRYEFPKSINLLPYTPQQFMELLQTESSKAPSVEGVVYAARWSLTGQLRSLAWKLSAIVDFKLAEGIESREAIMAAREHYTTVGKQLEGFYAKYEEHINLLNVFLYNLDTKKSNYDRNGRMREAFNPIELHPFMRREEQTGIKDIEEYDDITDPDEIETYLAHEREVELFMAQHDKKYSKENLTQAMDSEPKGIMVAIDLNEWVDDKLSRTPDEIKESAKIAGWAMLAAHARRIVRHPLVKELLHGSPLATVDWDTAKGGKALSLAVKLKSKVVNNTNFVRSMEERREYLVNARLKREYEDEQSGNIAATAVTGAAHDEQIEEIDGYIRDALREIDAFTPFYEKLYEVARKFDTVDDLVDYRTAFQRDPAKFATELNMTIEKIEIDEMRNGKMHTIPLWLATGRGEFDQMVTLAREVRAIRWEMTKVDKQETLASVATVATANETLSARQIADILDGLL